MSIFLWSLPVTVEQKWKSFHGLNLSNGYSQSTRKVLAKYLQDFHYCKFGEGSLILSVLSNVRSQANEGNTSTCQNFSICASTSMCQKDLFGFLFVTRQILNLSFAIFPQLYTFAKSLFWENVTCLAKFERVMNESGKYCAGGTLRRHFASFAEQWKSQTCQIQLATKI